MPPPLLFGPYGGATRPESLAQHGANAIWFHAFSPRHFDACAKHNLAACVEFPTFRADFHKRPDLIPIGPDGKPIRFGTLVQGICLSRTDFLLQVESQLEDGVRTFAPAGIWLDYLTYAGWFETPTPDLQDSCFCRDCIADFCQSAAVDADTPDQILARHATQWTRHKCRRIAGFAARYAQIIRDRLPRCVIGAYMCPWQPHEFDAALTRIFAQDHALLSESIDVFTPLIYAAKSGRSNDWACQFLQASRDFVPPGRHVQLILDVLDFPGSLLAAADCPTPSWGLQVFAGAPIFEDPEKANLFRLAVQKIRRNLSPAT